MTAMRPQLFIPLVVFVLTWSSHVGVAQRPAHQPPANNQSRPYDILAIYFGDWHPDPDMEKVHGPGWTEWNLVTTAQPRYTGHEQPRTPLETKGFGISSNETDPGDMAVKVQTAMDHGINGFLFDWYWYGEKGPNGGLFLDDALEKGFLNMKSAPPDFKFALMWANQDWVDIHPAKRGWQSTYRQSHVPDPHQLLMFDGYMNASVYQAAFDYVVSRYLTHPRYYKAPTRLANGTNAMCGYFSFYQPEYFERGVGGVNQAQQLLTNFRKSAEAAGTCVHVALMTNTAGVDKYLKPWSIDSVTTYNFAKVVPIKSFPQTPISEVTQDAIKAWQALRDHYNSTYDLAFAPSASVAWDSSPRCVISDPYGQWGYPWGASFHSTPNSFADSLQSVKQYMDDLCGTRGARVSATGASWCPPLLINAWNEWSEGAYLEPDTQFQFGKLESVKSVFGTKST